MRRVFNPFSPVGPMTLSLVELATGAVTPWTTIAVTSTANPRSPWR